MIIVGFTPLGIYILKWGQTQGADARPAPTGGFL